MKFSLLLLAFLLGSSFYNWGTVLATDYYVAMDGRNSNNGLTAQTAWKTITYALSQIHGSANNPHTIYVALGTYSDSTTGETFPLNMKSWVSLQGAGAEVTILDAKMDSATRVITCNGASNLTIDGFTITGGNIGYNLPYNVGGGLFCSNGSNITISNNIIVENYSSNWHGCGGAGGGICCFPSCSSTIVYNVIKDNMVGGDGAWGGGIYCGGTTIIMHNTITGNYGGGFGGGIACYGSAKIINNIIIDNEAGHGLFGSAGGGIYAVHYSGIIQGNTISNNSTALAPVPSLPAGGAGIFMAQASPTIIENVITDNTTPTDTNLSGGIHCVDASSPIINYNNIYGNTNYGVYNGDSSVIINAEYNWWGHESGPYYPPINPNGQGDRVSDYIDYTPWLTVAVGVKENSHGKSQIQETWLEYFPNPFQQLVAISYFLDRQNFVSMRIYDILGSEIISLVREVQNPGTYSVIWNGRNSQGKEVKNGMYFLRLETGSYTRTSKLVFLR